MGVFKKKKKGFSKSRKKTGRSEKEPAKTPADPRPSTPEAPEKKEAADGFNFWFDQEKTDREPVSNPKERPSVQHPLPKTPASGTAADAGLSYRERLKQKMAAAGMPVDEGKEGSQKKPLAKPQKPQRKLSAKQEALYQELLEYRRSVKSPLAISDEMLRNAVQRGERTRSFIETMLIKADETGPEILPRYRPYPDPNQYYYSYNTHNPFYTEYRLRNYRNDNMDNSDRWHFYWRQKQREHIAMPAGSENMVTYANEILLGLDWKEPKEGLEQLKWMCSQYKNYPDLDTVIGEGTLLFTALYADALDPQEYLEICGYPGLTDTDKNVLFAVFFEHGGKLRLDYSLAASLSGSPNKFKTGKLWTQNAQLMQSCYTELLCFMNAYYEKKNGRNILMPAYVQTGTSLSLASDDFVFPFEKGKAYFWKGVLPRYMATGSQLNTAAASRLTDLMVIMDNHLRKLLNIKSRRKTGGSFDEQEQRVIEEFCTRFVREYENPNAGAALDGLADPGSEPASSQELDFAQIAKLRKESDKVREALKTDEDSSYDYDSKISVLLDALSKSQQDLLKQIVKAGGSLQQELAASPRSIAPLERKIRSLFTESPFSIKDGTIVLEDSFFEALQDAYEDMETEMEAAGSETAETKETAPEPAAETADSAQESGPARLVKSAIFPNGVSEEAWEIIEQLSEVEQKGLREALYGDPPDFVKVAQENFLMPDTLAENINDAFIDGTGDFILDENYSLEEGVRRWILGRQR